ncbi:Ribonuclease H2 subunit C [Coemansia sp. RSA 552]|nr:Ribonuclease H2 subunit C [Coemansia sp. RSA 552]
MSDSAGGDDGRDRINLKGSAPLGAGQLSLFPCAIDYDGPAKTAAYFVSTKQPDGTYQAAFRGRLLRGCEVELPKDYTGHIVIESAAAVAAAEQDGDGHAFEDGDNLPSAEQLELVSTECFDAVTVWEHDRLPLPGDDDEFIAALAWADVAASIHTDAT